MKKKMGFNRVDTEYDSIKTIQAKIVHYGWVKAKKDLYEDGGVFIPEGTIGKVLTYVPYNIFSDIYSFCIQWQKSKVFTPNYDDFGLTVWKEYHTMSQSYHVYEGTYDEYEKKLKEMRAVGLMVDYAAYQLIPLERVR